MNLYLIININTYTIIYNIQLEYKLYKSQQARQDIEDNYNQMDIIEHKMKCEYVQV